MKRWRFVLLLMILAGCREELKPRFPVKHFYGHDLSYSIRFNKARYRFEEKLFDTIMKQDSARHWIMTGLGMPYYYKRKNDKDTIKPEYGDVVLMQYGIFTLGGDTIYAPDEIGTKKYAVDKEEYFAGLREAVKMLSRGEEAVFLVPSYLGYGYLGDGERIPPNYPFRLDLKILEIYKTKNDTI